MTGRDFDVIELFAGPGGMSEGMRLAGIDPNRVLGIERDQVACDTAEAAGHRRLKGDVSRLDPRDFGDAMSGTVTGLHASPPCQGFSMAGLGKGRGDAGLLMKAIEEMGNGVDAGFVTAKTRELADDGSSALTLEPMRWALDLRPEWVTLEQVPSVLPLWKAMGAALEAQGYSVVTANLQAEQYGVPQTRKRAVLIASRVREVSLPAPLHSRYYPRNPEKLDPGLPRWVSMAEALGWGMAGREELVHEVEPRVRNQSGTEFDLTWPATRPAPAVAGRGQVSMPGSNANRFNGATKSRNDGIRVTVQEAGVLQSFPAGYPWQGTKTAQRRQCGDAVPPLLGKAMIEAAVGGPVTEKGHNDQDCDCGVCAACALERWPE